MTMLSVMAGVVPLRMVTENIFIWIGGATVLLVPMACVALAVPDQIGVIERPPGGLDAAP